MNPVSLILSDKELGKLKEYIAKAGLLQEELTNAYELLRIRDGDIGIIVYKSGKIVQNGNPNSRKILDEILQREDTYDFILGSDETSKGEWFGPLVTTATALTPDQLLCLKNLGVRDSKTIKKPELMKLADRIFATGVPHSTITLLPGKYNAMYAELQREGKSLNDMIA